MPTVRDHNHCADEIPRKCPSHSHPDRTSSVYAHISTSLKRMHICNQQHTGASSSRSWGWALARFLSLLELLLLSSCSCLSALMMLFISSQQGLRLTYSSVCTVLPRGSIFFCQKFTSFAFSLSKPLSNFAYQNCLERVVLSSVPRSGTLSWTRWNITAFAQSHCEA